MPCTLQPVCVFVSEGAPTRTAWQPLPVGYLMMFLQVRLSLQEILGDLENKDLQLMLAMQDLTIATGEIKMATEMRRKLDSLSKWVGG